MTNTDPMILVSIEYRHYFSIEISIVLRRVEFIERARVCVCVRVFAIIVRLLVNHAMKRKNFFFIGNLRIYYIYTIYIYTHANYT